MWSKRQRCDGVLGIQLRISVPNPQPFRSTCRPRYRSHIRTGTGRKQTVDNMCSGAPEVNPERKGIPLSTNRVAGRTGFQYLSTEGSSLTAQNISDNQGISPIPPSSHAVKRNSLASRKYKWRNAVDGNEGGAIRWAARAGDHRSSSDYTGPYLTRISAPSNNPYCWEPRPADDRAPIIRHPFSTHHPHIMTTGRRAWQLLGSAVAIWCLQSGIAAAMPSRRQSGGPQIDFSSQPANDHKAIALTFDDGPDNDGISTGIVDILNSRGIPATFFVNTNN
jgi:hypothetical protein